jgi:translocation protein SEC63
MLEYDDSAFYYFSLAVLTFALLPFTFFTLRTMVTGAVKIEDEGVNCETLEFQTLLAQKRVEARRSTWSNGFIFRLFTGALLWYIWYLNFDMVCSIEGLQSFDPYQILKIENNADERTIRKQYRRLSLQMHPDKNPNNPLAVQEFIRLTKAYNVSHTFASVFGLMLTLALDFD